MRAIRTHGGVKRHHHTHVGTNGRLDTLQAAVLLAKWPHFPGEVEARAEARHRYERLVKDQVVTTVTAEGNTHVYAEYTVRGDEKRRGDVAAGVRGRGVPEA